MIWLALLSMLVAQDPDAAPPSPERLYERPAVRPYEPPSDFGRERAQGDDESPVYRKLLTAPVSVDAYRHSYEVTRGDADVAYDQGVIQAEIDYDTRMGPLDGHWSVLDAEGRTVASLVLVDPGDDRMIEGAWMRPAMAWVAGDLQPVEAVRRDLVGRVSVWMGDAGTLMLSPSGDGGWTGVLHRGDEAASVMLKHTDPLGRSF